MSGIFGLFHKDDSPVDMAALQKMCDAMAFWGPDGSRIWHSGSVGLGHLQLLSTPEAEFENLPQAIDEQRLVISAAARIDNREELADQLDVSLCERSHTPDSELILSAYQRWGEDCPEHLIGDWSFVVWNSREKRLFLARDQVGIASLFYLDHPRFFAFASSKRALLQLPWLTVKLNEQRFAQTLVRWTGDPEQTEHSGILRLLPGHALSVTAEQSRKRKYWSLENISPVHRKTEQEYVEGLMEVYRKAVRCRLRCPKPVGIMLSGGLDSGSTAVLAAEMLRSDNRPLQAFSSVPAFKNVTSVPNRTIDEAPHIAAIAEASGNIDVHSLNSERVSPVGSISRFLDFYPGPLISPINHYWIADIFQTASSSGMGAILTGQLGNATVSWPGIASSQSWQTLMLSGHWRRALKHKLIFPALPRKLRCSLKLRRIILTSNFWKDNFVITDHFVRRMRIASQMKAARFDPVRMAYFRMTPLELRSQMIWAFACYSDIWVSLAAFSGLEARDPTGDLRVVEYCLGIPDRVYCGPGGSDRFLIRQAMQSYIPQSVLWNRRKGLQSADIVPRLRSFAPDVEKSLERLKSMTGIEAFMDIDRLQSWWSKIRDSESDDYLRAHWILFGLACGLFLVKYFNS